jgi:hypothetical protein
MSERQRLPDRRAAEVFDFEHNGRKWTATFSRFADGAIAELFIDDSEEAPISNWRRRARSSPPSRFKADALLKHCVMHSPEGVRGRWALRWR